MKTSNSLLVLTAATLLTCNLFGAPITQYLKIIVADNSNLTVQQPTSMVFSFSSIGTDPLDANDMGNQNSIGNLDEQVHPFSLTDNNDIITDEDARPVLDSYKKFRFGFATKFPATIKIIAFASGNAPDSTNRPTYAWIEQISTGYIYPILGDTVKIDIPANLNFNSDFYLHTGPQITTSKTDETCYHSYNGSVSVSNPNMYNWNINLYKNTTLILSTTVNQPDTVISDLTSANYSVVTSVNAIPVDSVVLFVDGSPEIIADFSIDNYNPTIADVVNFTNASSGAITYTWTFGDGGSDSTDNTAHQYLTAGNYEVVLTATNAIGCQETVFDSVFVTDLPPVHMNPNFISNYGSPETAADSLFSESFDATISSPDLSERISISQNSEQAVKVIVMDMNGRTVATVTNADSNFEVPVSGSGIYVVEVISSKGEVKTKRIVVAN